MSRPLPLLAAFFAVPLAIGATLKQEPRFHGTRVRTGNAINTSSTPACALPDGGPGGTCHLDYFGGHVISNAKIYLVYWGAGVDPGGGDLGKFFSAVTNSKFLDWLNEYDTNITIDAGTGIGQAGTNQLIGRGTYAGSFTITPATRGGACPASAFAGATTCLTDADIYGELDAQITNGKLPRPDPSTIYFTFFPPHTFISEGNSGSCITPNGFCGYHSTSPVSAVNGEFYYAVMPDQTVDCALLCGDKPQPFDNLTQTAAHELAEAITDSEVGRSGNSFGPPLGWYDPNNGEMGDMCGGPGQPPGAIDAGPTDVFFVQEVLSNTTGKCETSRVATSDFSIALGPTSATSTPHATVGIGDQVSIPITLLATGTGGGPAPVNLATVGSLPTGVTATFTGTSANPMLTLTAASGTPTASDVVVAVSATAGTLVHTASLLLQIVQPVAANDYTISMTPGSQSAAPGTGVNFNISTTQIAGTGEAATITVSGLPSNVHATFSNGTATGSIANTNGGSDALTLTVDPASLNATVSFAVKAVTSSVSAGHTAAGTLFVASPNDFSLSMTPTGTQTMSSSGSKAFTVSAATVFGAPADIALAVSGLPTGVTGAFSTNPIQPAGSATLTLTAASAPAVTGNVFTVTGTDRDGLLRTITGSITVNATGDFSITLPSPSVAVARGGSALLTVNTAAVSGSPGTITLSAAGLPSGVTAGRATVTAGNSGSLTIDASSTAALTSGASFTVNGTAGSVTHSQPATLSVTGAPSVSITHPASGDTVSGNVEIDVTATAAPGTALQRIDVLVDGTRIGSGTTSPAQVFWTSTQGADGQHTVTAKAVDADSGTATTSGVIVTVNNSSSTSGKGGGGCSSSGDDIGALALFGLALRRKR